MSNNYDVTYSSYSGCDIVAAITIPEFNTKPFVIGELQTISYSIHREVSPVRTLGKVNPMGFVSGPRTIAGSLIFTVFDSNLVRKLASIIKQTYAAAEDAVKKDPKNNLMDYITKYKNRIEDINAATSYSVMDEMPPFDITISFTNEYGNYSKLVIKGVVIVDEGQVMSIEDMITENTMSYMARDIQVMERLGQVSAKTSVPIKIESDTSLKTMYVSSGYMQKFDPGVREYTVILPSGSTVVPEITAIPNDPTAKADVMLATSLVGRSRVRVVSSTGSYSDYYIRYKTVTGDSTLKNITIDGNSLDNFSPSWYNYSMNVYGSKAIPKVVGIPNDSNASVIVSRTYTLPGTTNIVVTADNGSMSVYSVAFGLLPADTNTYLSSLVTNIGSMSPAFDKDVVTYKNVVPYGTKVVPVLNAKTENSSSIPTIKQATALTGTYAVGTITVTAEDKTSKRVYTVTITEDFKPFATVFNGSAIGESITFKCRIGQMYSSGAIGIDSYLDTAYAGHSVYLDNNAGLSVRESATITGTYQGLIDTEFGQMYHVSVTSIS